MFNMLRILCLLGAAVVAVSADSGSNAHGSGHGHAAPAVDETNLAPVLDAYTAPVNNDVPAVSYGAPAPSSSYGAPAPSSSYGAPVASSSYAAPAPSPSYGPPASSYDVPESSYDVPSPVYGVPEPVNNYEAPVRASDSSYGVPVVSSYGSGSYGVPKVKHHKKVTAYKVKPIGYDAIPQGNIFENKGSKGFGKGSGGYSGPLHTYQIFKGVRPQQQHGGYGSNTLQVWTPFNKFFGGRQYSNGYGQGDSYGHEDSYASASYGEPSYGDHEHKPKTKYVFIPVSFAEVPKDQIWKDTWSVMSGKWIWDKFAGKESLGGPSHEAPSSYGEGASAGGYGHEDKGKSVFIPISFVKQESKGFGKGFGGYDH